MNTPGLSTQRRVRRRWRTSVTVGAMTVLAAVTIWRATILRTGWFTQNDFLVMERGVPLSDATGPAGFAPGAVALAQGVAGWAPLSWPAANAVTLALSVITTLLLWDVLTRLLPGRWVALPILTGFAVAPLTLWSTQWWTSAMQFWPGAIGVLGALTLLLRATARGHPVGWGTAVAAAASTLVAVLFDGRWVLAPALLFGIMCSATARADSRGREAVRSTLRSGARAWLLVAIAWVVYVIAVVLLAPAQITGGSPGTAQVTPFLRHLASMIVGGPWGAAEIHQAALAPAAWAVGVGVIAFAVVIRHSLVTGRWAARAAWATAFIGVAGLAVLLARAGDSTSPGPEGVHRYAATASVILAVCVAAAYAGSPPPNRASTTHTAGAPTMLPATVRRVAPAVAALGLAGSAAVTTPGLAAPLQDPPARVWVAAARDQLAAAPRAVLLDDAAPWVILSPAFGARATVSTVLSRAPERPVFDLPSHSLRLVGPGGTLMPVSLRWPVTVRGNSASACPFALRQEPTTLALVSPVAPGRRVLRLGYYTAAPELLVLDIGPDRITVPLQGGLNAVDIPVTSGFGTFTAYLEDPVATVCLATVEVGEPHP